MRAVLILALVAAGCHAPPPQHAQVERQPTAVTHASFAPPSEAPVRRIEKRSYRGYMVLSDVVSLLAIPLYGVGVFGYLFLPATIHSHLLRRITFPFLGAAAVIGAAYVSEQDLDDGFIPPVIVYGVGGFLGGMLTAIVYDVVRADVPVVVTPVDNGALAGVRLRF